MAKQKKQSLNKKPVIAIVVGIIVAAAVGATIAYRGDITRLFNSLKTGETGATFTEEFVSPDNWKPCDTQPKTITATNSGNQPIRVRVSYEQFWKAQDDSSLPLEKDGLRVAAINFDNQNDWTLRGDGWYYYNNTLQPGETTNSFISSVTFNCSYNLGTDDLNVCDDEGNCTTPANAYGKAKYHLKATIQTTQANGDWPSGYVCHSYILYNQIACQTNGIDSDIDFMSANSSGLGNGYGVNTLAAHANDTYPVYYFRGEVYNNFVAWAGYCWQAIRTTSTGGVKLIYAGESHTTNSGNITCSGNENHINTLALKRTDGNLDLVPFNEHTETVYNNSPAEVGYMYGDDTSRNKVVTFSDNNFMLVQTFTSKGLAWNGSSYEFIDSTFKRWSLYTDEEKNAIRYTCATRTTKDYTDSSNVCTEAYAILALDNNSGQTIGMKLINGETSIQDALNHEWANEHDSPIKAKIDAWFSSNLADRVNDLEDTVFCNDRTPHDGPLSTNQRGNTHISYFGYAYRGRNNQPFSVDCTATRDSFTVNEANGNGALTYPVGLITMDEVALSGMPAFASNSLSVHSSYLYSSYSYSNRTSYGFWTMTPLASGKGSYYRAGGGGGEMDLLVGYVDYNVGLQAPFVDSTWSVKAIRPVVSLKNGTYYIQGSGYAENPYIIP